MNSSDLLRPEFSVKTYVDFSKHCQKKSNGFLDALTRLTNNANPDNDTDEITFDNVNPVLESYGLSTDNIITVDDGFITIGDFIDQYKIAYQDYYDGTIESLDDIQFVLTDSTESNTYLVGLPDIIDSVKMNLIGSMMETACLESAVYESVSDRITAFSTKASNLLDLEDSSALQSFQYYKEKLLSSVTQNELLNQFFESNGSNQLNADVDPYTLKDFPISDFTGANPLGTLSFGCVKEAAKTIGKVVGAACVGIYNVVKSGVNWLWNKAKKYTVEVFDDPYDVTDNGDSKTEYCFNNFQYQKVVSNFSDNTWFKPVPVGYDMDHDGAQFIDEHIKNKWYVMKTLGGEIAVKLTYFNLLEYTAGNYYPQWSGTILFKPYSLSKYISFGQNIDEFITNYQSMTDGSYLDTKATESDLYNSFLSGIAVTCNTMYHYLSEYVGVAHPTWSPSYIPKSDTITNLDWLKLSTGYRVSDGVTYFDTFPSTIQISSETMNLEKLGNYFVCLIAWMIMNQRVNKDNVYNYVPYCCDTEGMSMGRFGIKTDAENQDIATKFTTVIVAIIIIAIVVITGAVIVRKLTRKAFWKRTEFIGRSDNAMWNGKTLTAAEKRKYIRYSRKLNACQLLSKGISSAETLGEKISSVPSMIQTTLNDMIKGGDVAIGSDVSLNNILHKITG